MLSWLRVLQTAKVTLTREVRVDEALTDATNPLTVAVTRLDGTAVTSGTSTRASLGTYTFALPGQDDLDLLQAAWTGEVAGDTVTFTDLVEIVGGFVFQTSTARARYRELKDPAVVTPARLADLRTEIEVEFETICGQAFVPRFGRHETVGRSSPYLGVPDTFLRRVRSVTVGGVAWDPSAVAALRCTRSGYLVRPAGAVWPTGSPVVVEYEHGRDVCPPPISTAAIIRIRSLINPGGGGLPDRAETIVTPEGASYRLAMPGADSTGIPDVDGALAKYPKPKRLVIA